MARKYISALKTNIAKENVSHRFKLKKVDETRKCFLEEIKHNELMSENHKKVCRALSCFEHFLFFISVVTSCVSISTFTLLVGVHVGTQSSTIGLKICAITAGIKK